MTQREPFNWIRAENSGTADGSYQHVKEPYDSIKIRNLLTDR